MNAEKSTYNERAKESMLRYQKENLEKLYLWLQKGTKADWAEHADLMGESTAAFVKRAVAETMARDRAKIREAMKNAPKEPTEEE